MSNPRGREKANRRRLLRLSNFLNLPSIKFHKAPAGEAPFRPGESLRGRVHLVVVPTCWKDRYLAEIFGKPGRFVWQVNEAPLDYRAVGVQAHDLVALRGKTRHTGETGLAKILDQLG